jgi:F1F0 ATPase subunit 2
MIMMNEPLILAFDFTAGILLGAVFFGGLWWTIRKGVTSRRPALWFLGSMLLRTTITVVGLYFVAGSHWERFVVCLSGFIIARLIITLFTRPKAGLSLREKEVTHAPQP